MRMRLDHEGKMLVQTDDGAAILDRPISECRRAAVAPFLKGESRLWLRYEDVPHVILVRVTDLAEFPSFVRVLFLHLADDGS